MADAKNRVNQAAGEHPTTDALESRDVEDFEHLAYNYYSRGMLPEFLDGLFRTIVENCPRDFVKTAEMAARPRAQAALRAYLEWAKPQEVEVVTTTSQPETPPDPPPKPTESELQPGRLYRYHAAANSVLASGIVCAIIAVATRAVPGWVGFLTGFTPALVVAALVCSLRDA